MVFLGFFFGLLTKGMFLFDAHCLTFMLVFGKRKKTKEFFHLLKLIFCCE